MTGENSSKVRQWVRWATALVWLSTASAVLLLSLTHIPATATVTVLVREVSFITDTSALLDSADQDRFSLSGPLDVTVHTLSAREPGNPADSSIEVHGRSAAASCAFYNVRTSPLRLSAATGISFLWPKNADPNSYVLRLRGQAAGTLSPIELDGAASSYVCSSIESPLANSGEVTGSISNMFNTSYGASGDTQLSFRSKSNKAVVENQIRISGPFQIAHIDPAHPGQEKGALLESTFPILKNQVTFDDSARTVKFNSKDLVLIEPGSDLYIRSLTVDHGIQLEIHGTVKNVLTGAGSKNYKSCMPSVFDTLNSRKRIFGAIPGAVTFVLTLLETLGLLPGKKK